jgi:RNA polymerase sigma-70 factor (ECF subfamily)
MDEGTINQLLVDCGRGDQDAFRKLYDTTAPQLLAIAKRILSDHQQAEDVLQQTMIAVWHKAHEFNEEKSLATTWLTAITRHRAIDLLRKRGRQQQMIRTDQHDIREVFGHDRSLAPSDPIPSSMTSRLDFCLGHLSRDQAGCVQLAYLDGLTVSEIADKLNRSAATVKSWIRRGLTKLRECIGQ